MPNRDYGPRRDMGLGWGDRDWEDRDFEGQWRVHGRPNRERGRDFDRERYQQTFGRGRDQPYGAFYGRESGSGRSPEASRYDAEDFGAGYGRDFDPRYDEWRSRWDAGGRGDLGDYGYRGPRRTGYGVAGAYGAPWRLETGRNYFGRGPRGYRRSDERIREEINDRLAYDPDLDPSDIDVRVESGLVTLSGVVEDRGAKRLAEDIVEEVLGVEDVNNELKVRHGLWARITGEHVDEKEVKREAERETAMRTAEAAASRTTATKATRPATR